ncbi:hypothetical protein E3U43_004984 [Larimichthys crocea]|uniref:Uncharacterized protein n=1 Tax=Larimichthys crocea TaxID=215358 RepID=A0ACD3QGJ9_LARCR|nr:hypothetical protein E3U43_004984 [Larimichthys crocea]
MLHPYYIEYPYFDRVRTQTACLRSNVVCFSGCIARDLNQALCFPPKASPRCQKASEPRTAMSAAPHPPPPLRPNGSACYRLCITTSTTITDYITAPSPHITTAQGREIPRT